MADLDEIKHLLEEDRQKIDQIAHDIQRIRRRLTLTSLYGMAKFLLIFVPLILGAVFFSPQIIQIYESLRELIGRAYG